MGRWGRNYVSTINDSPDVVLAAAASRNMETPAIVGQKCTVVCSWRELIDMDGLDGIIVATPPATHCEIVTAAIDKGFAVLVEKPLTLDMDEATSLLCQAQRRSAIALVDHIHLYSPAYQAMRREIEKLGPISRIEGIAGNLGPFRDDTPVVWDWGAHDVAMCLDLMEEMPASVRARVANCEVVDGHSGETIEIELQFSNGMEASITIGNIMREKTRLFTVHCRSGSVVYDDRASEKAVLIDSSNNSRSIYYEDEAPLIRVIREFANAINARHSQLTGLTLGVQVTQVLSRAERSMATSGAAV